MKIRLILTILFSFTALSLLGQARPSIRSSVTKNRILLGEPFQLIVESEIPGGSIVRPLVIDTIPHFEFLSPPGIDTIREASGIRIKAVYTLTSFDSGHWVIPSWYLSARIRTDTLPVDVVFSDFDPEQPYHEIKDIIEVEEERKGNDWWYWVAGGALLVILLALVLARRKKSSASTLPETDRDAYQEALDALRELKKGSFPAVQYYSGLVSILRVYLLKRKGIHSLQKTSSDLLVKIKSLQPEAGSFDRLAQALRLSDFVKFARYQPTAADDEEAWQAIRSGIEELEKLN